MSYSTTTPQSGQSLGSSRPIIQNNFALIQTTISQDHGAISGANQGKHNQSTYPNQGAGSSHSPVTLSNEMALYSGLDTASNVQLYAQKSNQLINVGGLQMTRLEIGALAASSGYSFLPGGVIVQWGAIVAFTNLVTYPFTINFPNNVFSLVITINIASNLAIVGYDGFVPGVAPFTGFLGRSNASGGVPVTWIAIGN